MLFTFKVYLTDQDYYEFNKFTNTNSRWGKKLFLFMRIFFAVCILSVPVSTFVSDGITKDTVISVIPSFILLFLLELLLIPFVNLMLKLNISLLKKSGKMPYSQSAVIEFFEDSFTETTDTNKTEHIYSAIEKICVIGEKYVFIYISSVSGYIIPFHAFDSFKQRGEFLEFIKGKCPEIKYYK